MKIMILENAIAALSQATGSHVLLVTLGAEFEDLDGMQVRDLADLRPIITQEAFDDLCNRGQVVLGATDDADQLAWMVDALKGIVPNCTAPVTALLFVAGEMTRIASNLNYSPPSGVPVAKGARD